MAFRRLLRGTVPWDQLEGVARAVLERYDEPSGRVVFLDADNWLSTPFVVSDRWFVKVITEQNSLVHALLTTGRNLGAFSSGTEGFFEHFGTPAQMADHELDATERMRELGVNAPEPIEAFEYEGMGVLVFEYLRDFQTLDESSTETIDRHAETVFDYLHRMHEAGLAHGDFRCENVLVADGAVYFIDATSVREDAIDDARAYDLACALGALEPLIGARRVVHAAAQYYSADELLGAEEFLDFVNLRPDHDFDAAAIRGAVEQRAN
ncbi:MULTISPECIES: RIO1 family regulatory kinase/ATPase [Haloarcula]|uniref:non-specific serine/threonine protein kinase n=1 Tax=Haloarcula pellucida TaxID=1427151 RepID=A0A830GGU6_9EURY|nr:MULTISPECIES: RIO1 family regulatory kinase/ATPase [Halomicroarcula]MBX0346990.1 protein kinase family protein [Halomicroarcula pellucida]MDS0277135.1 protein kinase family protein [Halomicroarcula sp. S1AR25-4]GGN86436.1 aminoglycoside phosphotransferase [Halomicroarcula pellucida]